MQDFLELYRSYPIGMLIFTIVGFIMFISTFLFALFALYDISLPDLARAKRKYRKLRKNTIANVLLQFVHSATSGGLV